MKNYSVTCLLLIVYLSISIAKPQVYIVHVKDHHAIRTVPEIEEKHFSCLTTVKKSEEEVKSSLLYSYKHVINGFSALLTPDEAQKLSEMEEVISVTKSEVRMYKPQTTRSWDFTNLLAGGNSSFSNLDQANSGKDVIVGVIDGGIWPESESFNDKGMEPVPQSWKGTCQLGAAFNSSHCNRKLIGARYYLKGYEAQIGPLNETLDFRSPRDRDGHGSHTASTVAGRKVPNISLPGGFANGTAAGGAPLARLAVYKVCWAAPDQTAFFDLLCPFLDILAAFDDAIADGVHVISISLASDHNFPYNQDAVAWGSFHAAKHDVVVVAGAGNSGPNPSSVVNVAPWIVSVGASGIDRVFSSPVMLGNGITIEGQTVTPSKLNKSYPLVFAGDAEIHGATSNDTTGQCLPETLSPKLVQGKIVLCLRGYGRNVARGLEVKRAGGIGFILENSYDGISISVDTHVLPGTAILSNISTTILNYIRTTRKATAKIVPVTTVIGSNPAPFMASFSATGPNSLDPNILKPDITAPGLNILAAWSEANSPTSAYADRRVVKYNIISGTSMSCPHVAAAAALVKAAHPDWSSTAIKSALMTTSTQTNNIGQPITDSTGNSPATPFNYGSGYFQPSKALDPGLVYDANYTDYLLYLCNFNSTIETLDPSFTCPDKFPSSSDFNYPLVAVARVNGSITVNRTVTNVGGKGVYKVSVKSPVGYKVKISPKKLRFTSVGQKESFSILIKPKQKVSHSEYAFGWYAWSDGIHNVRSPVVVSSE